MKLNRMDNAMRNVGYGFVLRILQIALPFLIRTVMIRTLGIEYLGLNSLFVSILSVLNLAELGVGSAMVYSMYKPITEDDSELICALLRLYRTYYRIIGAVIGVLGLAILPLLPKLVHSDVPAGINLTVLYLMNLAITVLSYWMFGYRNSLLNAHQRIDIKDKVTIFTTLMQNIAQIIALTVFHSYYLYLVASIVFSILQNLLIAVATIRRYPSYRPMGQVPAALRKSINRRVADLFTTKIGTVVINNADTIVISAFWGLSTLAVYQNYYYILTAILSVVSILFNAVIAGIGNSLITESQEKNFTDLKIMSLVIFWISGFCTASLLCLFQPFMELWMGSQNLLPMSIVVMFCVYYFLLEIDQLLNTFKDASGIWHRDRFRPLITAGANLCLNLLLSPIIGLYGVILSTVLTVLFIGMPWLLRNLFQELFGMENLKDYLRTLLELTIPVAIGVALTYWICTFLPETGIWGQLLLRGIVCVIVPNLFFLATWCRRKEFQSCLWLVSRYVPFIKGSNK